MYSIKSLAFKLIVLLWCHYRANGWNESVLYPYCHLMCHRPISMFRLI